MCVCVCEIRPTRSLLAKKKSILSDFIYHISCMHESGRFRSCCPLTCIIYDIYGTRSAMSNATYGGGESTIPLVMILDGTDEGFGNTINSYVIFQYSLCLSRCLTREQQFKFILSHFLLLFRNKKKAK